MTKINRDIWDLLPRLEAHVCGTRSRKACRATRPRRAGDDGRSCLVPLLVQFQRLDIVLSSANRVDG